MNDFKKNSESTEGWRSNGGGRRLEGRTGLSSYGSILNRRADGVSFAVREGGMTESMWIGGSVRIAMWIGI